MNSFEIDRLKARLREHEALRLTVYDDATGAPLRPGSTLRGHATIGYGRNVSAQGISGAEAELLLARDVTTATAEAYQAFPTIFDRLDAPRRSVLVEMVFNMGLPAVKGFTKFLAALEVGDLSTARAEMLDSLWAQQVGARAQHLAAILYHGTWDGGNGL